MSVAHLCPPPDPLRDRMEEQERLEDRYSLDARIDRAMSEMRQLQRELDTEIVCQIAENLVLDAALEALRGGTRRLHAVAQEAQGT